MLNVSYRVSNSTNSSLLWFQNNTNSSGYISSNFSVSSLPYGSYNITFNDNSTDNHTKAIPIYVTPVTSGNFTFNSVKPPFSSGSSFTINLSISNSTGAVNNYTPILEVYQVNGPNQTAWTITNTTAFYGSNGVITYNISIPSSASGQFLISAEKGLINQVISMQAPYSLSISTGTNTSSATTSTVALRSTFGTSIPILIDAKVRNSTSNSVNIGSSDTIIALVTYPNNSVASGIMSNLNAVSSPGEYILNFTNPGVAGTYTLRVVANISNTNYSASTTLVVSPVQGKLDVSTNYGFQQWSGSAAFRPGAPVSLLAEVVNTSTGNLIPTGTGSGSVGCNSNNFTFVSLSNILNSSALANPGIAVSTKAFNGLSVCSIDFNAPGSAGMYKMQVNVTIGGSNYTLEGSFLVQEFLLKATAVNLAGGDFMTMVQPGGNTTLAITAFNLTSNALVGAASIQNISVSSIAPLQFGTGGVTLNSTPYYSVDYSSNYVTVAMPANVTGPMQLTVSANVTNGTTGRIISGTAVVFAKYVMGFMAPAMQFQGQGGPNGGGFGGVSTLQCSGSKNFSAQLMDVTTMQPASNVHINGVIKVGSQSTGQDYTSCITATPTTTDTSGSATVNVTFMNNSACSSLSGQFFMLLNVTYQGNQDSIPSGFNCQGLSFFVNVVDANANTTGGVFRVAPYSSLNVSIQGVTNYNSNGGNGSSSVNGTLSINYLQTFVPGSGQNVYYPTVTLSTPVNSGVTVLAVNSSNFSGLNSWPSGASVFSVTLSANDTSTNVTGMGGFYVVPFDAWISNANFTSQYSLGQNVSWIIDAKTNVSSVGNFTIQIGQPWEGKQVFATIVNVTQLLNQWSKPGDVGVNRYNVTFTIPSTIDKGQANAIITVNSSASNTYAQTTTLNWFLFLTNYNVVTPLTDHVNMEYSCNSIILYGNNQSSMNCTGLFVPVVPGMNFTLPYTPTNVTSTTGGALSFNMSFLNYSYNIASKSNRTCVKLLFNASRDSMYGLVGTVPYNGPSSISSNSVVRIMLVDNAIAGVYDTIVFYNDTGKTYAVFNNTDSNRTINANFGNTSYWKQIRGCESLDVVNPGTASAGGSGLGSSGGFVPKTFLGDFRVNQSFSIPVLVQQGVNNMSSMNISVAGIANESLGNTGFNGVLPSSYYTYTSSLSDGSGVAFLTLNFTKSGDYELFWALNKTGANTQLDRASFQTSMPFRVRAFITENRQNLFNSGLNGTANTSNMTFCAYTFSRLSEVVNMTVNLRTFNSFGAPTLTPLQMYNASTGANLTISGISQSAASNTAFGQDGPGCVRFYIGPTGSWPSCTTGDLFVSMVNATDGTETQDAGYFNFGGC